MSSFYTRVDNSEFSAFLRISGFLLKKKAEFTSLLFGSSVDFALFSDGARLVCSQTGSMLWGSEGQASEASAIRPPQPGTALQVGQGTSLRRSSCGGRKAPLEAQFYQAAASA